MDIDLYCDDVIASPYDHYRALRDMGPAVWLPRHELWAIARDADVRAALRDHDGFASGAGVAANPIANELSRGTTLASDGPLHSALRRVVAAPLQSSALAELRANIERAADDLIIRLAIRGQFDGIADLARFLPVTIVSNLVGLAEEGREAMLDWAAAVFDALGPLNARGTAALESIQAMFAYVLTQAGPHQVRPGSWAARIYAAVEAGQIAPEQAPQLLLDYLAPSLDTTIFATGHLLEQLGRNPAAWSELRANPALIPNAIDEALRLEAPIRGFTRQLAADRRIGDVTLPDGARVLLLYASANRDERRWEDPDRYDIHRPGVAAHLGFGHGRHVCAGMHLARLELTALLAAMVRHIRWIEVGTPVIQLNNLLRGYSSLPVSVG